MENSKKIQLGFHLRLQDNFEQLLTSIEMFKLPVAQFFLAKAEKKRTSYVTIFSEEKKKLHNLIHIEKVVISIHASYWINASSGKDEAFSASKRLLMKELNTAQDLNAHFLVMHPGTANGFNPLLPTTAIKQLGIERLAKLLNEIIKNNTDTLILLENTAHGNNAIGSDLADYMAIKNLLNKPEKVKFCFDTAHAFAYGYDIKNVTFLEEFKKLIPLDEIGLIHLNDIDSPAGSKQDKHAIPGNGLIGIETLKEIAFFDAFRHIPQIIELPAGPIEIIQHVINLFNKK